MPLLSLNLVQSLGSRRHIQYKRYFRTTPAAGRVRPHYPLELSPVPKVRFISGFRLYRAPPYDQRQFSHERVNTDRSYSYPRKQSLGRVLH